MGTFPTHRLQIIPYLTISIIAVTVYFFGESFSVFGQYDRTSILAQQWWRLFSAHLLHTNFIHLLVNLVGVVLLWMLHGDYTKPKPFVALFLVLSLCVSLGIFWFSPHLHTYVGLSGVLHGMFAWGVIKDIQAGRKSGYLLLIGLVIKLIEEQYFADNAFMSNLIEASVAIDAHFYGAVAGIICGFIIPAKSCEKN